MQNKTGLTTQQEFELVLKKCRDLFEKKMHDYGSAWRIMRPISVTDQIYIKANRIRSIEIKGNSLIEDGVTDEFIGIINYSLIGLIQLKLGAASVDSTAEDEADIMAMYDEFAQTTLDLMLKKNHDYDEAWRHMRVSSFTDLILMKTFRTKQIENLQGQTLVSEGIDANYMDMLNYSVFALIKLLIEA